MKGSQRFEYIFAIDPSTQKSGICIYSLLDKKIERLSSKRLWEVFNDIALSDLTRVFFFVENSNLVKGNWHGKTARSNVGKNKSISQNIVDYLEHVNASFYELKPQGYSLAYTADTFEKATGCKLVSNKDNRAAAAMIYMNPLKVKVVSQMK